MGKRCASIVPCMLALVLAVTLQSSFAGERGVHFTSVGDGGTISIFPDSFPVERAIKGKVTGFSKEEIASLGLTVDVSLMGVSQGPVAVDKKGKWVVKATLNDADLIIKAVVKDKDGNELATETIKAVASREF